MLKKIWPNKVLIIELIKRDFSDKYQGSLGGLAWSFVQPLFLLTVYTIAFGVILKARWGSGGSTTEYAFMLFAGLMIYNAFSETLTKSTSLITANPNFVKKVMFPLELLSIVSVMTVLLHLTISCFIWFLGYCLVFGIPEIKAIFFPLIYIALLPLLLGISWLFSSISVFVRDAGYVVNLLSHSLLFLTPIFYSIETAPASVRNILMINPLTYLVETFRDILFEGKLPEPSSFISYVLAVSCFSWCTLWVFKRLQPNFADVL